MTRHALRTLVLLAATGCGTVLGTVETGETDCDPILDRSGDPTGFVRCEGDVVLRTEAIGGVPSTIPGATCTEESGSCTSDADCGELGACRTFTDPWSEEPPYCGCVSACEADSDCGTGQVCVPPAVGSFSDYGRCTTADCTTNDDCDSGECSYTEWTDGCSDHRRLSCRTPDDACRTDQECADLGDGSDRCAFDSAGTIECTGWFCDIGRPLTTTEGAWRRAPIVARADWAASLPDLGDLPPDTRAALVAHWSDVAALEHASVASFARHTLELMALGAPPDLLLAVQQASSDEIRHARLAFGVLEALGDGARGPGALPLHDVDARTSPVDILIGLLVEGCLGETQGAAEAAEAAARATGPLRDVLAEIAADEARHAALAWRTVRWMIEEDPTLLGVVHDTLASARPTPPERVERHELAAHGMLSPSERAAIHARVWDDVIVPASAALGSLRPRPSSTPPAGPRDGRSTRGWTHRSPTWGDAPGAADRRSPHPTG